MERKREYEVEFRVYELVADPFGERPEEVELYRETLTLAPEESIYDVFVEQGHAADMEITQYEGGLEADQAELLND